ncbi:hypothetical protein GJW-30_1_02980 [Variibacter gotjawalensis]|uniref:DUF5076 domain-containing protein n=1 Tax=Variibacter gotjawalensis TaxID=1333996 RepID=A0A0S3PWX3_9BRAD|nr:DUF5076 domain-containing protein [Variibacter gotjawalensis]NIK46265.1 hypothetical protein [Variibacter gotjawalensis]RZS48180.1 uncharacterized protein DUF5076 [Variibacter gotjawalensis]BAT60437.1 hypothetical protein GJW-30_1_02980 [Variibacter gotjawalensis]
MAAFEPLEPPPSTATGGGTEILRGVVIEGALHISLRRAFDDPQAWGMVLADLTRHVARIYKTENNTPEDRTIERIRNLYDAEMDAPTDLGTTQMRS